MIHKREWFIHILVMITMIYLIYYFIWRLGTLNPDAMVFSVLFLLAEAQGIVNLFLFAMMTWSLKREHPTLSKRDLVVDIFVPTYNEDLNILEATIIGCNSVSYPHTTYVLDDGRRQEVKDLVERLGCEYITRLDNKHAKAGNINHALTKTRGEFIAIFDADTVPQPDYLDKTLGYFEERKVAIVQLPQEFYNDDSVQHAKNGLSWHEQQLFYRIIQPGKNHIGASFWCGSPSIVRRSAIEDIGGVATDSITEDLLTTLRLNANGWSVKYHDEILAFGIAPQTLDAFRTQRLRWAQGAMQIFFSSENPLIMKGLTWRQRLSHFAAIWTYFDSYQKLLFLIVPSWYIFTHQLPMNVTPLSFLLHWIPYYVLGMLTNLVLGRGYFHYLDTERYNILKMFTFIRATSLTGIQKHLQFKVTPKNVDHSMKRIDMQRLTPLFASLIFALLSVTVGIVHLSMALSNLKTVAAVFWTLFNAGLYGFSILTVMTRKYFRSEYRFPINVHGSIELEDKKEIPIMVQSISLNGIGFIIPNGVELPNKVHISIDIPSRISFEAELAYVAPNTPEDKKVGAKIVLVSPIVRNELVKFLYVTLPRRKGSQVTDLATDAEALVAAAVETDTV